MLTIFGKKKKEDQTPAESLSASQTEAPQPLSTPRQSPRYTRRPRTAGSRSRCRQGPRNKRDIRRRHGGGHVPASRKRKRHGKKGLARGSRLRRRASNLGGHSRNVSSNQSALQPATAKV